MPISKDLLLAILSMDAYNRGYGAGINGLGESGTIGNARILARSNEIDINDWQAAGFYAVSYKITDGSSVDGLDTNDVIISYRGTDKNAISVPWSDEPGSDAWNGYGIALGSAGGAQAKLAAEFYQAVTGTSDSDPRSGSAILTGHSLGGGLAGFIGGLYGKDALIFDNMPFERATLDAFSNALSIIGYIPGTTQYHMWQDFYNGLDTFAPVIGDNLSGIAVTGEFVTPVRIFQSTDVTILDANGGYLDPFYEAHSISLLSVLLFARDLKSAGGADDWAAIGDELWLAYFSDEVGKAGGYDPKDTNGVSSEAGKMGSAIAYSALDEGTLVFGNTGIRAMFDDANELGKLVTDDRVPSALEDAIPGITQTIVQFAGQMALREVRYQDHEDRKPEEGLLGLNAEETVLKLDLAKELWNLGGEDP
ncbi:MAG: hypothetical protein GY748_14690, partial [Planctomycetaceae bacterium]|nr:hypothetical protein [Planctomycetaceae bacterium]